MGKNTNNGCWLRAKSQQLTAIFICLCICLSANHAYSQEKMLWGEVYLESVAEQQDDYNIISDLFIKQGIHAFKIQDRNVDIYFKARLLHDQDKYYWNNRVESGIGCRYSPFSDWGLVLFAEYLYNDYTGRENSEEPNPDDSSYFAWKGGFAFWQWWDTRKFEIGKWNLNAWREIYGDGIYHEHDNHNFIVTLDYKEGILLGHLKNISFEGYISAEAGFDTRGDEWNHYAKAGPGFRITPFSNLDMKISIEYFWGCYTRGGFDDTPNTISDAVISVTFWHGW